MNGILDAAADVDVRLRQTGVRYCMIGGIALQRWGQPRMTLDVDVAVMTQFGNETPVIEQLLRWFRPRISDAAEFALQSRVLLLTTSQGVGVDVSLGALPFEERMIDRSSIWSLDETRGLRTCSAEDLIVQKVFAGREQDWVDVGSVIDRQAESLGRELILAEIKPLLELKEDRESLSLLMRHHLFRMVEQ